MVEWSRDEAGSWRQVPIIAYKNTDITDGSGKRVNYRVAGNGAVSVKEKAGVNRLKVSYRQSKGFVWALVLTGVSWLLVLLNKLNKAKAKTL